MTVDNFSFICLEMIFEQVLKPIGALNRSKKIQYIYSLLLGVVLWVAFVMAFELPLPNKCVGLQIREVQLSVESNYPISLVLVLVLLRFETG